MITPDISIIIPVLDEADIIDPALQHLKKATLTHPCEVILVDGDQTGDTINAIDQPGLIKIISKKGRGAQMNAGAAIAAGAVLLFLHADTRLPVKAMEKIKEAVQNPLIIGGAFDLGIDSKKVVFRWIEKIASIRSRITRIPYGDQAIFIRKDYFQHLGGFLEIPIMEDIELMRRIKRAGGKIRFIPVRVLTSPRRWEREGAAYCTIRNILLSSLFYFGVSPARLKRFYD